MYTQKKKNLKDLKHPKHKVYSFHFYYNNQIQHFILFSYKTILKVYQMAAKALNITRLNVRHKFNYMQFYFPDSQISVCVLLRYKPF